MTTSDVNETFSSIPDAFEMLVNSLGQDKTRLQTVFHHCRQLGLTHGEKLRHKLANGGMIRSLYSKAYHRETQSNHRMMMNKDLTQRSDMDTCMSQLAEEMFAEYIGHQIEEIIAEVNIDDIGELFNTQIVECCCELMEEHVGEHVNELIDELVAEHIAEHIAQNPELKSKKRSKDNHEEIKPKETDHKKSKPSTISIQKLAILLVGDQDRLQLGNLHGKKVAVLDQSIGGWVNFSCDLASCPSSMRVKLFDTFDFQCKESQLVLIRDEDMTQSDKELLEKYCHSSKGSES